MITRSKRFYVDKLGFDETTDSDMGGMGRWLEVAPGGGGTAFVLANAEAFGKTDLPGKGVPVTEPDGHEFLISQE